VSSLGRLAFIGQLQWIDETTFWIRWFFAATKGPEVLIVQRRLPSLLVAALLVSFVASTYADLGKKSKPGGDRADKDYAAELPRLPLKSPLEG
jgi:hypothetical protein